MPAVERAVLDLGARVIGHDLAAAEAAADKNALAREGVAEPAPARGDKIRRPAIKRRGEFAGRHARAVDDRLVIAGEKSVGVAELVDADGAEIVFEEFRAPSSSSGMASRARSQMSLSAAGNCRSDSLAPAALDIERLAARAGTRRRPRHGRHCPSRRDRSNRRLVLRAGKFDRRAVLADARRRNREEPCKREQAGTSVRAAPPAPCIGLIARLRSRPLSSWDRARRYRARRSTHR